MMKTSRSRALSSIFTKMFSLANSNTSARPRSRPRNLAILRASSGLAFPVYRSKCSPIGSDRPPKPLTGLARSRSVRWFAGPCPARRAVIVADLALLGQPCAEDGDPRNLVTFVEAHDDYAARGRAVAVDALDVRADNLATRAYQQ